MALMARDEGLFLEKTSQSPAAASSANARGMENRVCGAVRFHAAEDGDEDLSP